MTTGAATRLEEIIEYTRPEMPVCNCASCNKLLVTAETKKKFSHHSRGIDTVFVRARGVPFCRGCSSDGEVRYILSRRFRPAGAA